MAIQKAVRDGLSLADVVDLSGVVHATVYNIVGGQVKRVDRRVADAVTRAVTVGAVTPIGVLRRVQALTAQGWGTRAIAERAHVRRSVVQEVLQGSHPHLDTRQKLAAAYEDLKDADPVPVCGEHRVALTKAKAQEHGWLPPHVWEDGDRCIDNPRDRPASDKVPMRLRYARLYEEFENLRWGGVSWREAVERITPEVTPVSAISEAYRRKYGHVPQAFHAAEELAA